MHGMESLTVDAGHVGDTVNVNSTFATTPVTVNGNGGPMCSPSAAATGIRQRARQRHVNGGAGTNDSIRIDDTLDSIVPADDYTVSDVQTTKTRRQRRQLRHVEAYTLDANGSGKHDHRSTTPSPARSASTPTAARTRSTWLNNANRSFVTIDGGAGLRHGQRQQRQRSAPRRRTSTRRRTWHRCRAGGRHGGAGGERQPRDRHRRAHVRRGPPSST
jgi:hypothetical protein